MSFNFIDKTEAEADIITEVLQSENIMFKTKRRYVHAYCENDDSFIPHPPITIPLYTITAFTTIEHFEFVKNITNKKIETIKQLNKTFYCPDEIETKTEDRNFIIENTKPKSCFAKLLDYLRGKQD